MPKLRSMQESLENHIHICHDVPKYSAAADLKDPLEIRELLLQKKDTWQSEGVKNLLERLKEMPLESIKERLREANSLTAGCEAGYTFQFGGGMKMEKAELKYV